jgi:hypothetical protein
VLNSLFRVMDGPFNCRVQETNAIDEARSPLTGRAEIYPQPRRPDSRTRARPTRIRYRRKRCGRGKIATLPTLDDGHVIDSS